MRRLISKSISMDGSSKLLINVSGGRTDGIQSGYDNDVSSLDDKCVPLSEASNLPDRKYLLVFIYTGPVYIGGPNLTVSTGYKMRPGRTGAVQNQPLIGQYSNRKQFLRNSYLWIPANPAVSVCVRADLTIESANSLEFS